MKRKAVKTLALLLTAALVAGLLAVPALAAQTATGTTLRLEKTSGTVTVKDSSGKAQTLKDGMRLYSGYSVKTSSSSSAYVSLDGSKAVKLDSSTSVKLKKSGSKLELTVESGKLFFDVKVPLSGNESMEIRTSTMVTGVRGTSGWVEIIDRGESHLHLLEGRMTMIGVDPVNGITPKIVVVGGQSASAKRDGNNGVTELKFLTENEVCRVPGFVAEEVKNDTALQAKIKELSPSVDVDEIASNADKYKAEDEAAEKAKLEEIADELKNAEKDKAEQVYEPSYSYSLYLPSITGDIVAGAALSDTSVNEGGEFMFTMSAMDTYGNFTVTGYEVYSNGVLLEDYTIGVTEFDRTYTISNVYADQSVTVEFDLEDNVGAADLAELQAVIDTGASYVYHGGELSVGDGESLVLPARQTLEISGGFFAEDNGEIVINGAYNGDISASAGSSVVINGSMNGEVTNSGTVENNGTITSVRDIGNYGVFTNNGTMNIGNLEFEAAFSNTETSTFNNAGTINFNQAAADNYGSFNNTGEINIGSDYSGATFTNSQMGTFTNRGDIYFNEPAAERSTFTNYGTFEYSDPDFISGGVPVDTTHYISDPMGTYRSI